MKDLIGDSMFGKLLRTVTRQKYLRYPEELDPSIWEKYAGHGISSTHALQSASLPSQYISDRNDSDNEGKGSDTESRSHAGANQDNAAAENGRDALMVPTALATNFGMLLAFPFLTGFFGSPVLATGGASIGDMYAPRKRAYDICIWGIAAVCGPTMGPLVGGFAVQATDWT